MSSETSTEQFYFLLAMIAATVAVVVSRHTHPVALVLLSAAILGAGLVAMAFHRALAGFFGSRHSAFGVALAWTGTGVWSTAAVVRGRTLSMI